MERKPWQGNGPQRNFDRFDRYENDRADRGDRGDRFGRFDRADRDDRADRFGDRYERREFGGRPRFDNRFENRGENRFDRREGGDRFGGRDRFDRNDRFERADRGDRRQGFSDDRRGGYGQRPRQGQWQQNRSREAFGVRSGPRARAYDERRYVERSDFAKNAVVRIDSDIADFFGSPEAVNKALRLLVDAARVVNFGKPEKAAEETLEPATAAQIFAPEDVDDDEEADYGSDMLALDDEEALDEVEAADEEAPQEALEVSDVEEKSEK